MKKILLICVGWLFSVCLVQAQEQDTALTPITPAEPVAQVVKFGFLSYNTIFKAMPEYEMAQQKLQELKAKYDEEARRTDEEFQRKFSEFLQGQNDFPENILHKRQNELQGLLESGLSFKKEAQKLLAAAEKDLYANMLLLLNEAIRAVGLEHGYAYIINTDGNACPFINPSMGEDVTNFVKEKLQLPISIEP